MKTKLTTKKQIVLGLGVAFLAIGFSSFTSAKKHLSPGDEYGNTATGQYTAITNYDSQNCQNDSSQPACAYQVTSAGASHVTGSFTTAQASTYLANGWISALSSDKGLYIP